MLSGRTRQGILCLAFSIVIALGTTYIGYAVPQPHEPIVGALIWTGRLAFLVFLTQPFARPLHSLYPSVFTMRLLLGMLVRMLVMFQPRPSASAA